MSINKTFQIFSTWLSFLVDENENVEGRKKKNTFLWGHRFPGDASRAEL